MIASAAFTAMLQRYLDDGRSTVGAAQKNDFDLSITGGKAKRTRNHAGQKRDAERAPEMSLAAQPYLD